MVFIMPSLNRRLVISAAVMPIFSLKTLSGIISEFTTAFSIFMTDAADCSLAFFTGRNFLYPVLFSSKSSTLMLFLMSARLLSVFFSS